MREGDLNVSSKITHLKGHGDGWWRNTSADRELGLGLVTLAPGAVRFVDAKTVARSGGAFDNAISAGRLAGPFASREAAEGRVETVAPAPPDPAPVAPTPAPEPVAAEPEVIASPADPVTPEPVADAAGSVTRKKKRGE